MPCSTTNTGDNREVCFIFLTVACLRPSLCAGVLFGKTGSCACLWDFRLQWYITWNRSYLSGLLMNRRGGKNLHSHPIPFLKGRGSGIRALQSTAPPWLVCGFPLREVSWSFSESLSRCCLWAFVVSTLSFVQELINASSKSLSIFFFFSSVSCFPGSLSYMLGVPGEHEEGRRALGILFIYFLPVLLLSQASYL